MSELIVEAEVKYELSQAQQSTFDQMKSPC